MLKTAEAAAYPRVSKTTLRKYVATGLLPAYRVGPKNLRFDPADLDALVVS